MIKHLKNIFIFIKDKRRFYFPGLILYFVLFLISTVLNSSLTYMGNKSEKVVNVVFDFFLSTVILYIFKILFVYLFIGIFLSIIFYMAIDEIKNRIKLFKDILSTSKITMLGLMFFYFLLFSQKLIITPQAYVENFSQKFFLFQNYQHFLTDNVSPLIFDLFIYLMAGIIIIFFLLSFDLKNIYKKFLNKAGTIKFVKVKLAVASIFIIFYFIYNANLVSYNNKTNHPNILILSADALRPNRFSHNGYNKQTTPNIDRMLKKNAVQFRGTISALTRTFPAWVSILTSRYPMTHGILHMFQRTRERNTNIKTVPMYMNKLGYRTAVISDSAGEIFPRFNFGFKKILAPNVNFPIIIKQVMIEKQTFLLPFILNKYGMKIFPEIRGITKLAFTEVITEEIINEIKLSRGKPFFIVSFYSITHYPFSPPYPYYKKFTSRDYKGPFKYMKNKSIQLEEGKKSTAKKVTDIDKRHVNQLYDGSLNLFDKEAGRIFDYLKKNDLLKNTIILITSDHGENLYEKEVGLGHGEHLKGNNSLEVPFIIISDRLKKLKGKTFHITSSIIDMMPTVFDIAGIKSPDSFDGVSLLNVLNKKNPERIVDAYCETGVWFDNNKASDLFYHHLRIDYPNISGISELDFSSNDEIVILQKYQNIIDASKYRTIYSGDYKLIYIPLRGGPKFELYNHKTDPENNHDLSEINKTVLENMKDKFYKLMKEKGYGNFIIKNGLLFPAFVNPIF